MALDGECLESLPGGEHLFEASAHLFLFRVFFLHETLAKTIHVLHAVLVVAQILKNKKINR